MAESADFLGEILVLPNKELYASMIETITVRSAQKIMHKDL